MHKLFNLFFNNDGGEREHYGVFTTRAGAEAEIADCQQEHGTDVFPTAAFEITEDAVHA